LLLSCFSLPISAVKHTKTQHKIWALAKIEEEIINDPKSLIRETFEEQMTKDPGYWVNYYNGSDKELRILRTYSYSDRIRYYWTDPEISKSLNMLIANLEQVNLPESIVSQAFMGLDFGEVPETPLALIELHIQRCISRYFKATGH